MSKRVELETDVGRLYYPHGYVDVQNRMQGIWEIPEADVVRRLLEPGDTFLDIGAHVGYFSVLAAKIVGPKGRVFSFEPKSDNYDLLRLNVDRFENVRTFRIALSDEESVQQLRLSHDNSGDNRLRETLDSGEKFEWVEVNTFDKWADRMVSKGKCAPFTSDTFVKVDAQGHDHRVMLGMTELSPKRAIVEHWPEGLRESGQDPDLVTAIYSALGYSHDIVGDPNIGYWSYLLTRQRGEWTKP